MPVISKADPAVIYMVPASGTYANFNVININKNPRTLISRRLCELPAERRTELRTAKALNEARSTAGPLTPELA